MPRKVLVLFVLFHGLTTVLIATAADADKPTFPFGKENFTVLNRGDAGKFDSSQGQVPVCFASR